MLLPRVFAVWLVIIAAETVHGVLRGLLLVPFVGDLPARQIGVPIGSLIIFAVASLLEHLRYLRLYQIDSLL
jgi:hypothetical protein